jgi:hypothetical protein
MRATLFTIALFAVIALSKAGTLDTLETPSYKIKIESRCPEGFVTCDDVKYVGVSKKTGKSITLIGKTVHAVGADGVTPAHFLGYEFTNGSTTYFVSDDGEISVKQGKKILVQETGVWKR